METIQERPGSQAPTTSNNQGDTPRGPSGRAESSRRPPREQPTEAEIRSKEQRRRERRERRAARRYRKGAVQGAQSDVNEGGEKTGVSGG